MKHEEDTVLIKFPASLAVLVVSLAVPATAENPANTNTAVAAAAQTQTARAGSYWVLNEARTTNEGTTPASYTRVENLCITQDGKRFFGIQSASGGEPAIARTETGPVPITLAPVDASASKRHYRIGNPDNTEEYLMMNFIAHGAREMELPSATAGLLSISGEEEFQVDCIDNDTIVMVATFGTEAITVLIEDGELVLRETPDGRQNTFEARGGLLAQDGNFEELHFVKGGDRITIDLSRDGQADGFGVTASGSDDASITQPQAYFIADPEILSAFASQSAKDLGLLVSRLTVCNHFAGEASEDAERNAQIAEKIAQYRCMELPAEYDTALAAQESDSDLHSYLTAHSPSWR